ncbi:ATP-binding cassette sub-family A member 12 [Seriola lalandi dorsalis]|uniref:ATP-binding cassette sub-family A member 12 n=2 Tax=Seriola lalandi dorsalis TaxID=1841481 RepID=UPI000C6F65E0|nr:ATP-binding cassette sub-family A member 12 [Seriola lalandi dorsalis]
MAFFQQLRLLLWKNGLQVIRQPAWSLTLIAWPLVIFIIIAVTRNQFPPVVKDTCYVAPRNLPSTGFFPFLQTLMCNADSNCHNKSRLVDQAASKATQKSSGRARSTLLNGSPLANLAKGGDFFNFAFSKDRRDDPAALIEVLNRILGPSYQGSPNNVSLINTTHLGDQETLNKMLESVNLLKRAICTMTLPMINTTSPNTLTSAVVTFCHSNNTVFEVSLDTLNQILTQLMLTKPDEMLTVAGMAMLVFDQLQNQTSLWESLLAVPQLFSHGSVDQVLSSTEVLLTNIQGAMHVIQSNFPEAAASLSTVHPLLAGGINVIRYVQNWPGKDVSISLGEVVTLQNDTLSEMVKPILQQVQIPLDKAIGLTLDRNMVRSYLCDNSSNPIWLTAACSAGTVDMVLGWISPDKVAKQALLAWSEQVAPRDVSFAKGLLHSLIGGSSPGGQGGSNTTRARRSVDTQPQTIDEELFLGVGQVVMEIIEIVPEVDMVVQSMLRTGFQAMMSATLAVDTAEEMMANVLKDANQLKSTYLTLLTNQSEASVWIGRVLDSVTQMVMKSLASESYTCEEFLGPFEWLLNTESVEIDVWRSAICQNSTALQQALLMDWLPLIQKAQELYSTITGQTDFNVTLPMILSEWHKLSNSSGQFAELLNRLGTELGGAYWMNWMPDISTNNVTDTLQQSVYLFMVNLGEKIENSQLWPEVKNYFHMAYWILNYRPGVTTQPANCSLNISTLAIHCDTGLNWTQFVQAITQALMSPSQDFLVNSLKGTLNLLQHVYGDIYKHQAASFLKNEIEGGDALSDYLINLMHNLDIFLKNISSLPDSSISNTDIILPHLTNLLQSTGLAPLLPLFLNGSPPNVSTVLDIASKLGRLNQHIFTFNETDPTLPELERLITQFLSLEGNLTIALPHIMGQSLLTYSDYFDPDEVALFREAIQPFTNQTSTGFVEAILRAIELLKAVTDPPNGDPSDITLGYVRQLQELVISLYRLRKIEQFPLPSGQLSAEQVTDLQLLTKDFLSLLLPEGLQNLTQAGPDAARDIVIQKFVAFLPLGVRQEAVRFLQDVKTLEDKLTECAAGQDCLAGISEIFTFLDQILSMMLSANGTVTIKLAATNLVLEGREYEELTSMVFSLLLAPNDAAVVETFKNTLHFTRLLMTTPNISVSDVQNALGQSNLTLEELNNFAALAGAANINDLMVNIMEIINARQCFEPQHDPMVTAQCVMGLINGVSGFLTHLPNLRNETSILSLIPLIVNTTFRDVTQANLSSNPYMILVHTLNSTLANIKMSLQLNQLNTPEIMNEIMVVEGLIELMANTEPLNNLNTTLMMKPIYYQKLYLEIVEWYLKRLENITSSSSVSSLLQPFFNQAQIQVTVQLAYANFTVFVTNQVEVLMNSLQFPIDGAGVSKIGQAVVEILQSLYDLIKVNLVIQNNYPGSPPIFNTTTLNAIEAQIKLYLDLIQKWMKQPNVPLVLTSMLQWGNSSINISTPVTDIQDLLQTVANFLSDDQLAYFSVIRNITQSLNKALMVAEQPGGIQSDHFFAAITEAFQSTMQILTTATDPVPPSVQQNILEIVQGSLKLIVQPDMSFASSRNISLLILNRAESVVQQIIPEMFSVYLLSGLKVATTYFESISTGGGPDNWNQMILNEMKTVQSLLPPNSTAQAYVSVFINITHFILESGQGNMSLWASFENASVENVTMIIHQMVKLVNKLLPLLMGSPDLHNTISSSVEAFAHLSTFLQQVIAGEADQNMWDKLEKMLEALLSPLEGTELWYNISAVIPLIEKSIESTVNNIQAQNEMILSLQIPVVTLMREIAMSVNTSHFNLSEVTERMQLAIERTLQAAQQANATLECSEALKAWEPVGEAAGLSPATMAMWCNISLQPVLEAYAASQTVYSNLNMSHMGVRPMNVSATAAAIVKNIQLLYQGNVNATRVTEQLIMTLCSQFSMLAGQPLSLEAQSYWLEHLQEMQLQNSLSSIKMLTDELRKVAPFLQPYIGAMEKALYHMMSNSHLISNSSSCQDLLKQVAMIFLTSANITSEDIFSINYGNFSGLDEASLTGLMRQAVELMTELKIFGDEPMVYQALEQFLTSNGTILIVQKVANMSAWLASTQASGLDLLTQVLPKMYDILKSFLSVLSQMSMDMPANTQLFEDLAGNIIAMLRQLVSTSGLLLPMHQQQVMFQPEMMGGSHAMRVRHRREAPLMPTRDPMDDFIDLFYIDYPAMFKAISGLPTEGEIMETVHMFFANPDLSVVLKGATSEMPWGLNASREDTINAALGVLSFLTLPSAFQMSSMDLLVNAADMLPDGFPFSSVLRNISRVLANESQENLILMQQTLQTVTELVQIGVTDPQFTEQLGHLRSQVCALENTESVHLLMRYLSIEPGQLCHTFLPSLQILVESLMMNTTALTDAVFQTFIGNPSTYNVHANWTSVLSRGMGFNTSILSPLNINITSPGAVTVGEMLRNETAFILDVQQHMDFDPIALYLLMETTLPNNNLEILSWLVNLRQCNSTAPVNMKEADMVILKAFCSLSVEQWYSFSLLMARHVNMEKVIYRMVLSEEMQGVVGVMLQMAEVITDMMNKISPAISQLQSYLLSIEDLNLVADNEFSQMTRGQRSTISTKATFVTLSRALCSNGILALFGISKLPVASESNPSFSDNQRREEMIERFKIPRNATPFCMNMYLDMVNTTGGAIAWAFLKPMLMGHILYTPDTPVTRAIMEKANTTLQEFANLRKYSKDWIDSSNYIMESAVILSHTLPMLQNSLGNSFVKNFIEMQTDINVGRMKETLSNFSNMTVMLEKNKHILNQITTLSTLMVDLSSCIKFDRYRGYDSAEQLNTVAQELAKNRDLYASVIFKLPKDEDSSKKRKARSSSSSSSSSSSTTSSTSSLPPKVSYTIRMHMDNVMRTDRVRDPYFVKDTHILARQTMRYNRGFVYLQENIDRAIIETQTGQRVSEPAVQLQPFPYPCHLRDEYLEAISFVFPLMLMIAWVLFVADFVKKLVHERELRLHEYMKMMGVNPLSHFFAWFLECAAYLVLTIFILTLVLKYGRILPSSDGFLLFLYLCDYGLSILAFSYLISSFFDKTYIAGLSGSLLYILCFFPFIVVMALETNLTFSQKSALSVFSPTCFSYASQYISRYESQGEGIHWSNSYTSPIAGDTASFGWLCWLMLIDSVLYFIIGAYIRMVFPGKYGIPAPWYFPFKASFWADLCCCIKSKSEVGRGLLFTNIMQGNQPVFNDDKGKGQSTLSSQDGEDFSALPVGVALHGLGKIYGDRVAIENLNVSFYEGHVTSLLGHNGAGKTTTMSLLTGLFAPSSGTIEVYGRDMQTNIDDVRRELGVCMQYDVLFDHMTTKEHLLLYGQIKAPHWSHRELHEQVRTILEETGMYAHRHKRVGTLSGGMKRKLSISIAFIGGSRLVVLDEPTTGVDPCSRRSIWDIVIQHKKQRTIILSTHHLDEAEVLSDRIAFLERGGLKCCGSPFHLKDKLGQGYKLTLTKKMQNLESEKAIDNAELKAFIQAHVPEARLKEAQGGDLVYSLPPFTSSNASSYRSLLTALDSNLDALQLGGYGISDTTLEEVFLQLTHGNTEAGLENGPLSISETVSDTGSIDSFPSDTSETLSDRIKLTGSSMVRGMALAWQQMAAILMKRFQHSRRDWKGLISQILLPVLFVVCAMGLGSIKSDLRHYPELELSPALYNIGPSYSFFRNQNPNSKQLVDTMMSFPGIDNACFNKSDNSVCTRNTNNWSSRGNSSKPFSICKCTRQEQVCDEDNFQPPHKRIPSSQIVYNLSGINVENYLVTTANDFIRNRYGGFDLGMQLPPDLQMDLRAVPKNRTLSKVWFNPEGHHTMPAYLSSLNNLILRSNLPADKDPRKYAISVSSHPYFGRADDEDAVVQGMLQILVAMCVLTGFSITTASFAIYEVNEHHSGSKRLQHIAGVGEPFYWAVNFLYDMVIYMIPVALTVGVIAAFQIPAFTERQNLGAITLLLVLFGFATFPWMYLLSSVFKDAEMAFITYVCINLFISINTIMSTSILYFLGQISMRNPEAIKDIFEKLSHAFLIFPQFNFGNGLMQLARMNIEVQILSGYGIDAYRNPFSTDALGWMFISSFIQGVVFFTMRLLLNKFLLRKVRHLIWGRKAVPQVAREDEDEDVDVAAEHQRVSIGAASSDILQVNQLTKVYHHLKRKVHAVKRVSVGIPAGECFGLLGVNGAGKTTTFKMLTGDVSPTDGTAQIRDWDGRLVDIMECRNQGINIGYCPQVDALDNLLTGEEHLYFYARIRGISKREIEGVVNYLLKRLELNYHRNIITDGYSCGTRRKLSTALALIGHPQILLLDEPSSGMDPRTKRHLWKIISEEVKGKCAVVLTSHSMEECEALCSRLAIMVKGQFRCLGSLQHIKNRFGSGFTVKMYLAEASCDTEAITGFMQRRFPSTYLKDQHSTMVEYHVPVAPGGVADIFDQLESNKNALQIKHFSVSQTTLDEVFINFAMGKIGMETIPIHNENEYDDLDSIKAVQT